MKAELIILIGASGSGKTTYANRLNKLDGKWCVVSFDEYRLKRYVVVNWLKSPSKVFNAVEVDIYNKLSHGYNVVYDACNISFYRRYRLFHKLKPIRKNVVVTGLVFQEHILRCIIQDKSELRTHHVGALTIIGMKFISFCNSPKLAEGFDYLTSPSRFLHDRYKRGRVNKKEFLSWFSGINLPIWTVSVDKEIFSDFAIGCFFDNISETWKVYMNKERGRHIIKLETRDEECAFAKLKNLVEYIMENNRGYI